MLENLRRKSFSKTYNDHTHRVHFKKGHAIYLDSCSIDQHKQRLSKEKIGVSFPERYFTTPNPKTFSIANDVWGVVEKLNGVEFNMIYCPSGTFMMGHRDQKDNLPKLETIERPFLLGETEIPRGLIDGKDTERPGCEISWYEAIAYCNELSELQGLQQCYTFVSKHDGGEDEEDEYWEIWKCDFNKNGYRLPTEKEWEYAAKSGTQNRWAGTDEERELDEYAWFGEDWNDRTHPYPVKTKKPNEWGFYDMSGNLWEWCWDTYNPRNKKPSADRVCRGGTLESSSDNIRIDYRSWTEPISFSDHSFRLCRSFI